MNIETSLIDSLNIDYATFLKSFNSSKFTTLREGQEYILNQYATKYLMKKDIAIELPTGAGKSLISLLIAELWRQNGYKVAILTANKTLARQMKKEAEELNIPSVIMEGRGIDIPAQDKRAYQRKSKIAIMNYWVYINQNPVIDPSDLLIMDDAHLAEHCLHSLYSVEINRIEHPELFNSIVSNLLVHFPEYTVLHDAMDENAPGNSPPELLSFIDHVSFSARFKEIVDSSEYLQRNTDLMYRWNRLRHSINESNIYLGHNSIWVRPYIYPLNSNPHFTGTTQRIYMSATIGDPSDLCRRLGVRTIEKVATPTKFSEDTNGRRLIIMNKIEDDDIPERLQIAILETLKTHPKSIWLCSSENEAKNMKQIVMLWLNENGFSGHPSWLLTNLGDEIEQFKNSKTGHLFIAGRFDGMDFKGSECRLVILNTLPRAINIQEEFFCAYLRDSEFMIKRLNQRIIQALGRCNREPSDYGIYILADRRFATHFGREAFRKGIPKNISAEIDLGEDAAEEPIENLISSINKFINNDFTEYDEKLKIALESAPSLHVDGSDSNSSDEVLGWTALYSNQNYRIAADKFLSCYNRAVEKNLIEVGAFYAWCQAKALYLDGINNDPAKIELALEVLEKAVIRGGQSSWFNRLRASYFRAIRSASSAEIPIIENYASTIIQRFDDFLEEFGMSGTRFQKWIDRTENFLTSGTHNEFQKAIKDIGILLGYNSINPSHNAATDCRWRGVFGSSKEVITFEAKIEHEPSGLISATAIGQVHNQKQRALAEFSSLGYTVKSCIVTHLCVLDTAAEASAGDIKIIKKEAVIELWERIKTLLVFYRNNWSLDSIMVRRSAANMLRPKLPKDGWLIRVLEKENRWINESDILNKWPAN